jgi:hypothetical protein
LGLKAPIKEEKMKKTIAILLVMTIALAGVFAANVNESADAVATSVSAAKKVTLVTTVDSLTTMLISNSAANTDQIVIQREVNLNASEQIVGHVHVVSNNAGGWTLTVAATALANANNAADATQSFIGYALTCGDATLTTVGTTTTSVSAVDAVSQISFLSAKTERVSTIRVTLDSTEMNAAVSGQYAGEITFTVAAN